MSGPFYGCDMGSCSEEITYESSDLRVFRGKLVCDGCWDYRHEFFDDLSDDDYPNQPEGSLEESLKKFKELKDT